MINLRTTRVNASDRALSTTRVRRDDIDSDGFLQFGKHEGDHVCQLPETYLKWLLGQTWISERLRSEVETRLETDLDETHEDPADTPARIAFPLILFQFEEKVDAFLDGMIEPPCISYGKMVLRQLCESYTHKKFLTDAELAATAPKPKEGGASW